MNPPIAIAHDYLAQYGGAERVVAEWSQLLPDAPIYTLAYAADATYPEFRRRMVRSSPLGRSRVFSRNIPAFLPVLPLMAQRTKVTEDGWVLVSSSGFAHGFESRGPKLVYCHSPARWIYEPKDYARGLGRGKRAGLKMIAPYLRHADRRAAHSSQAYVANSAVTKLRIERAYGKSVPVVHPPVGERPPAVEPRTELPEQFALCVARARGYKNVQLAIESARLARTELVIVGSGSEQLTGPGVIGLGRVSDGELSWLYEKASLLLAVAREDFGLTPVEAGLAGTPTVAIAAGGYRETIERGVNGELAGEDPGSLARSLRGAMSTSWRSDDIRDLARRYSPQSHLNKLMEIAGDMF